MVMELLCPIPSHFLIKSLLQSTENGHGAPWSNSCTFPYQILIQIVGKWSWISLGKFLYMSLSNHCQNQSKMLLDLLGQIPFHVLIKSLLKSLGNGPGAHWANTFLEVRWAAPLHFFIKSSFKSMENGPGSPWANSLTWPYWIPITNNGKLSWNSLGKFLYMSLLNPYQNQWKMVMELLGPIPLHFLIESLLQSMENGPGAPWANSFTLPY